MSEALPRGLAAVLESAARLQQVLPDAVLVGGSAAAWYARHRMSTDHDHVLQDLRDRYDLVLDALDREGDWVFNRGVPGKVILGELGGIEAGVRQLIRERPLETQTVHLPSGAQLTVPTLDEIARIKGFLVVKRNQMRDHLDIAAIGARFGFARIGGVLSRIDDWYTDPARAADRPVQAQLARQLADPAPRDRSRIRDLSTYKSLEARWHDWAAVVDDCRALAVHVAG